MANEQLEEKMTKERTGNKLLTWCVVIACILLVLLIFFGFIHNKGDEEVIIQVMPQPEPIPDSPSDKGSSS